MTQFSLNTKKAEITCDVTESWFQLIFVQFKCGKTFEQEVTKKLGVMEEQIENLESAVSGSLGFAGIGQLESSIKASTAKSVKFEKSQTVKQKIKFKTPEKGRYICNLFQKKKVFNFNVKEYKLFGHRPHKIKIELWLDEIRDESTMYEYDPECDKQLAPEAPPDGYIDLVMQGGKYTMSVPYRFVENGIKFDSLGLGTTASPVALLYKRTHIDATLLPEHAKSFVETKTPQLDAMFVPSDIVDGILPQVQPQFQIMREPGIPLGGNWQPNFTVYTEPTTPYRYQNIQTAWSGLMNLPLIDLEKF